MDQNDRCSACFESFALTPFAIYTCDHCPFCLDCTIRERQTNRSRRCPVCRNESPNCVVVTPGHSARPYVSYLTFYDQDMHKTKITQHKTLSDTFCFPTLVPDIDKLLASLVLTCPMCAPSKYIYANLSAMKKHLEDSHLRYLCDHCARHQKIFFSEQRVYRARDLEKHLQATHPECSFCKTRFYIEDDLMRHLAFTHHHCSLCADDSSMRYYYESHDKLYLHYQNAHFPCMLPECRGVIVFARPLELQQHLSNYHHWREGDALAMAESRAALRGTVAQPPESDLRPASDMKPSAATSSAPASQPSLRAPLSVTVPVTSKLGPSPVSTSEDRWGAGPPTQPRPPPGLSNGNLKNADPSADGICALEYERENDAEAVNPPENVEGDDKTCDTTAPVEENADGWNVVPPKRSGKKK